MRCKQFTAAQKQRIARELLDGRLSEDEALLKIRVARKKDLAPVGSRLPGQLGAPYNRGESACL
jgi:hypothetical protein